MKWGLVLLIISAIFEALWNIALKKSQGLYDWQVNTLGLVVLVVGIITFKKAIGIIPLSIAIVIWSGVSLMLTILLDVFLFKTKIDFKVAFFMGLCIISIIGLNYYSKSN